MVDIMVLLTSVSLVAGADRALPVKRRVLAVRETFILFPLDAHLSRRWVKTDKNANPNNYSRASRMRIRNFELPLLVVVALSSFAGGLLLPRLWPLLPAAHVHLALAMGVMPLIFGAMQHFIPVLTRSGEGRGLALLPFAGALTGRKFSTSLSY